MLTPEIYTKHLVFIKYLHKLANEESEQPEPFSSVALLMFHDSVEMFLQLAAEHVDAKIPQKIEFSDYWEHVKLQNPLTQKDSMKRLNKARVNLKHFGTRPSVQDIEAFRVNTNDFFIENTPRLFGIAYSDISLIDLVQNERVKHSLKEAEKLLKENDIQNALDKIALAFSDLIYDYEKSKVASYWLSPFDLGPEPPGSFSMNLEHGSKIREFVDDVGASLVRIKEAVEILSLGVDYRRYAKFKLLTPEIIRTADAKHLQKWPANINRRLTSKNIEFCIGFVIESAVALQKFDFDLKHIEDNRPSLADFFGE